MRMSSGDDIRPGLVDLRMDDEAGLVDDGLVPALGDVAGAVDEDQVRCLDGREVLGKRIDPEMILQDGVWHY